jgi:septal ring factor EnvC (AmiA/AmiB activator)
MNKTNTTSDQKEQPAIGLSLKLAVLAAALTTIADAIATVAALEAIDEFNAADTQAKQDQQELDDKLNKMQRQINILTYELSKIKKGTV